MRSILVGCKDHGLNLADGCELCDSMKRFVQPEILQQLGASNSSDSPIPDAVSWLNGARVLKKPTLTLSQTALDYAVAFYYAGPLQPRGKFEDIVREHLFIDPDMNEQLTSNLKLESCLVRYEGNAKFRQISELAKLMLKHQKQSRLAQRPLCCSVQGVII